jgi:hypothetical protein
MRKYQLAAEIRNLLLSYGDICDGPTLEALGAATNRAMLQAENGNWFDWDSVKHLTGGNQ